MARQRIAHGAEIDVVTPEELAIAMARRRGRVRLALGGDKQERLNEDFPVVGFDTIVTSWNRGTGGDNFTVPANEVVALCKHNPRRIAGSVQNIGANPVYVYLGVVTDVIPGNTTSMICGYMASGGEFNFKLTDDVWAGPVSVWSSLGSTLVWGEH